MDSCRLITYNSCDWASEDPINQNIDILESSKLNLF